MDIQTTEQIKIADYLRSLEFPPVKQQGIDLWYKSLLREETEASFKVDTERNQWYGFAFDKDGNVIALVQELYCSDRVPYLLQKVEEQTPRIRPVSFSFGKQSPSEPNFQQLRIIPLSSPALLAYLQEKGMGIAMAKRECSEAHLTHNGKRYFAIAFPNVSGGYEIRNQYFKGYITSEEISHIKRPGTARETCHVFEGFMDYLSFLILKLKNCPKYPELDRQDYMVLDSVTNVSRAIYPLGSYERIHCFLDNGRAGMRAMQQIYKEYGRDLYIRDASQAYSGCKDLGKYLQGQAERSGQVQSAKGVCSQPPRRKDGFRL